MASDKSIMLCLHGFRILSAYSANWDSLTKKLIFVSGFYPLKYQIDTLRQTMQLIHVLGEFSEDLCKFFANPTMVRHVIPKIKLTI